MTYLSGQIHVLSTWTPARQGAYVTGMLLLIGVLLLVIMSFAVFFYCLESLHSEHNVRWFVVDRSEGHESPLLADLLTLRYEAGQILIYEVPDR